MLDPGTGGRWGLVAAPECRKFVAGRWLVPTLLTENGSVREG
jgi:hypothetical protein